MKTVGEIADRIAMYEKAGYTRPEAIEIVKIERLVAIGNRLKELSKSIKVDGQ